MDEKIAEYDADYKLKHYEFQKNRDEDKFALEKRIKGLYQKYKEKDSNVFDNALILDADEIKFLVKNLESISLSETDLDIKGKVFQKFFADFFLKAQLGSILHHLILCVLWLSALTLRKMI